MADPKARIVLSAEDRTKPAFASAIRNMQALNASAQSFKGGVDGMLAPMRSLGASKAEAEATARKLLGRVKILEQADKYPAQLSGGQQQRVAIARALCMRPKIMLFDEVTSALDPEMVKEVLDTMMALALDGMTMLVVSHEMGFARQVADRMVLMDGGEIIEINEPQAFFTQPRHERTRLFLSQILR